MATSDLISPDSALPASAVLYSHSLLYVAFADRISHVQEQLVAFHDMSQTTRIEDDVMPIHGASWIPHCEEAYTGPTNVPGQLYRVIASPV